LWSNFDGNSHTIFLAYICFVGKSTTTSPIASTLVALGEVGGVDALKWPMHEVGVNQLVFNMPKLYCLPKGKVDPHDPISVCLNPKIKVPT